MEYLNSNSQILDPVQSAIKLLKNHFSIQKVYLFGSQAQNTAHSESDYDLVVLTKSSLLDPFERRVQARNLLKDLSISFDVFIYTAEEAEKLKNDFGSIVETAVNTGREIEFL